MIFAWRIPGIEDVLWLLGARKCMCLPEIVDIHWSQVAQIHFANSVGLRTRLVHQGKMGYKCPHRWMFPSVVYVVFNDQDLRERFGWAIHDTLGVAQAFDEDMMEWLQTLADSNDITNILKVVESVLELRGMPRMCAMLRAVWCFTWPPGPCFFLVL